VVYDVDADEEVGQVARDADDEAMRITERGLCCQRKKKTEYVSCGLISARRSDCE